MQRAGFFAVNVMEEGKGETTGPPLCRERDGGQVSRHGLAQGAHRRPVLDDALAWLDCRVTAAHPAGDHTIFVGEVLAADAREGTPLLYYRGGYGRFAS